MADTVTLEHGQNALLNVGEEPRRGLEHAQILLLQMEELTVSDRKARAENVILEDVQVRNIHEAEDLTFS